MKPEHGFIEGVPSNGAAPNGGAARPDPGGVRAGGAAGTVPAARAARESTPCPPKAGAFFDLDRTLMAGSSGVFFAKAAFQTGMISRRRLARDLYEGLRFRLLGSTDDRADAVRVRVGQMIAGVPVREMERLAPRVLAGVLPRLYPEMLASAYSHQDAGRPVYIVTAASQEMAEMLAHVLAFDGGLGSRSEVRDGLYTGRAAGPFNYREGKARAVRELAQREGIELAASYAYSDSESDLPMLRAVGHPVAVNPDSTLERVAREEGWEVVRLDRLGRRLKLGGALALGATAVAGAAVARGLSPSVAVRGGGAAGGARTAGARTAGARAGGARAGAARAGGGAAAGGAIRRAAGGRETTRSRPRQ